MRWYFDVISPFAWLQLPAITELASRIDIQPVPVVLGAMLQHFGQLGPAEIPSKREFTYRHVLWRARRTGRPLVFPPAHPFNSLAGQRLIIAAGTSWAAIDAVFTHVWQHGRPGDSIDALLPVARDLGIEDAATLIAGESVKSALRDNTSEAIAAGVFGVPMLQIGDALFWGEDATAMATDHLDDPASFADAEYRRLTTLPAAIQRTR